MEYPTSMLMHPIHSARPVDARWLRIKDLADHGSRADGEYDDEWIRRGLLYVIRFRQIRDKNDRELLLCDFLGIDVAYQLHTSPDTMKRCLVEARLLARQSVEEVAAICGLSVEAVVAYEKIFFQVLGRLKAFLFIIPNAIGIPLGDDGLREEDTEKFIKLYAYQKGPMFLEIVLRYFRNGVQMPKQFDQASRAELDELALMLRIRAVIWSRVLPVANLHHVLQLTALIDELRFYAASLPERNAAKDDMAGMEDVLLSASASCGSVEAAHLHEPASIGNALRETVLAA
jgi:hypothetical protein